MTLITLNNIHKTYRTGTGKKKVAAPEVHALQGLSLSVQRGERVAIMGKSGSGKSTLLNILGALDRTDQGSYLYDGQPVPLSRPARAATFRRDHIGFIVQDFALIEDLSVQDNVALPLRYGRTSRKRINRAVLDILARLGIEDKARRMPLELSGGEQQRVAIARAVVHRPDLILADEPTGALDEETGRGILDVFDQLHQDGRTLILVTHDEAVARSCQRIIRLRDGQIDGVSVTAQKKSS